MLTGNKPTKYLFWVFIGLLILTPRLSGLDGFVTVDEPDYIKYGGNYYYALGQRDFSSTLQTYQPAVTTILFSAATYHLMFPEYRGLGQGYFIGSLENFNFLRQNGQAPMEMLVLGRLQMVVIVSCILLLITYFLMKLFGLWPAIISVLLISFDPFFLGHSRLLTQESLMSVLVTFSVISMLTFLYHTPSKKILGLSAIAGGIAFLTKVTALILLPFIGLLIGVRYLEELKSGEFKEKGYWKLTLAKLKHYIFWLLVFLGTVFLVWPAMWVAPIETLKSLFGTLFGFLPQGSGGFSLSSISLGAIKTNSMRAYLYGLLWRTTPIAWGGWIAALYILLVKPISKGDQSKKVISYFAALGISVILIYSAGKLHASHYIMLTHVSVNLAAGLGYGVVLKNLLLQKMENAAWRRISIAVIVGLIGFQIISSSQYYPYYYNYRNPIALNTFDTMKTGSGYYGEGLDLAAKYLAQKPGAENLKVMSWWAGTVAYLFPGETYHLKPQSQWGEKQAVILKKSDYLVIYYQTQIGREAPSLLIEMLADVKPEKSFYIHGIEYIRIYNVHDLPEEIFNTFGEAQ